MDKEPQKAISALKEIWHKMDGAYEFYAKSQGLNTTTVLVAQLLINSPDEVYTQKDICEKLELPKQVVNSIVKSFWEQGFIELREARDRRNKEIIVTQSGRDYKRKMLKPLEDAELAAWEGFSAEEITAFAKTLEKYVKNLERILKL